MITRELKRFCSGDWPIKEMSLLFRVIHQNTAFFLLPSSRALSYCYDLHHPGLRRAPQVGTVGLRNPPLWVLYGRRVIRFLGSALCNYWLVHHGHPRHRRSLPGRRLLPRRRQPPRRHGWRGHRPLKEICPGGNNKVIIYFLISW